MMEGTLGFVFLLAQQAPAGAYSAKLVAIDAEELESNPVTTQFEVE